MMDDNELNEIILDALIRNPAAYAELRLESELKELSFKEIQDSLQKEIEMYKVCPNILYHNYPTPEHFLDYYNEVKKKIKEC
jgi:hypothetical protein